MIIGLDELDQLRMELIRLHADLIRRGRVASVIATVGLACGAVASVVHNDQFVALGGFVMFPAFAISLYSSRLARQVDALVRQSTNPPGGDES